jgi:putative transposase
MNKVVNQLPWTELNTIGIEDIKSLKKGKKQNRGKVFRKALAPWTYAKLLKRIEVKAQENRVRLVKVSPAYSSQECPVCGMVSKMNRKGEDFNCIRCSYKADADYVGAVNVLVRTLQTMGSHSRPLLKNGNS